MLSTPMTRLLTLHRQTARQMLLRQMESPSRPGRPVVRLPTGVATTRCTLALRWMSCSLWRRSESARFSSLVSLYHRSRSIPDRVADDDMLYRSRVWQHLLLESRSQVWMGVGCTLRLGTNSPVHCSVSHQLAVDCSGRRMRTFEMGVPQSSSPARQILRRRQPAAWVSITIAWSRQLGLERR